LDHSGGLTVTTRDYYARLTGLRFLVTGNSAAPTGVRSRTQTGNTGKGKATMAEFLASFLYAACADTTTGNFAQRGSMSRREAFVLLRDSECALLYFLGLPV
jgi:hypothetical protein